MLSHNGNLNGHQDKITSLNNLNSNLNNGKVTSLQSLAKLRWKMISKVIHEPLIALHEQSPPLGSTRKFSSFGLIYVEKICANSNLPKLNSSSSQCYDEADSQRKWLKCTFDQNDEHFFVEIHLLTDKIPLKELIQGFDNTGNICLWPSEEILAYYCFKNKNMFDGKIICELGGGMTCLAGITIGLSSLAKQVILTDGNNRSICNVELIVKKNGERFGATLMTCKELKWGNSDDINDLINKIDIILCSDCLYFDQSRESLIETISKLLNDLGLAVILSPTRGKCLQNFLDLAKTKFHVKHLVNYDSKVWDLNQHFINSFHSQNYNPDLHYPHMIILRKRNISY